LLMTLLKMLDAPYNDIYLHIDIKAQMDMEQIKSCVSESMLYLVERRDVRWGHYSLADCEIRLLEEATKTEHSYYHLLSGHDLPIKPRKVIYDFFENNAGVEYVAYNRMKIREENMKGLIIYVGIFKNWHLEHISRKIQKLLRIDRSKRHNLTYMKGSNWFSITHELAKYVVASEGLIRKLFRFTWNSDEMFLQTIVYNSPFREHLVTDYTDIRYRVLKSEKVMVNYRAMDWADELGSAHPRNLTIGDLEALKNSKAFWARKFATKVDASVIQEVYNLYK